MHGDERFVGGAVRSFSPSENRQASRGIWRERRSRGDSTGERSAGDFQCLQLGSVFPLGHKELHSSFSLSLGVIYFGKEDGIVGPLRCEKVNEKEKKKRLIERIAGLGSCHHYALGSPIGLQLMHVSFGTST